MASHLKFSMSLHQLLLIISLTVIITTALAYEDTGNKAISAISQCNDHCAAGPCNNRFLIGSDDHSDCVKSTASCYCDQRILIYVIASVVAAVVLLLPLFCLCFMFNMKTPGPIRYTAPAETLPDTMARNIIVGYQGEDKDKDPSLSQTGQIALIENPTRKGSVTFSGVLTEYPPPPPYECSVNIGLRERKSM